MKKLERSTTNNSGELSKQLWEAQDKMPEAWSNDVYSVFVRRHLEFPDIGSKICHISFHRHDRRAIQDWRHMQWMKNQLVGEEHEGVELFPAERRLVDGANEYHIWVFEDPEYGFPFGFYDRLVTQKSFMGETQRKFPANRMPKDLEENEAKMQSYIDDFKAKKDGSSKS